MLMLFLGSTWSGVRRLQAFTNSHVLWLFWAESGSKRLGRL